MTDEQKPRSSRGKPVVHLDAHGRELLLRPAGVGAGTSGQYVAEQDPRLPSQAADADKPADVPRPIFFAGPIGRRDMVVGSAITAAIAVTAAWEFFGASESEKTEGAKIIAEFEGGKLQERLAKPDSEIYLDKEMSYYSNQDDLPRREGSLTLIPKHIPTGPDTNSYKAAWDTLKRSGDIDAARSVIPSFTTQGRTFVDVGRAGPVTLSAAGQYGVELGVSREKPVALAAPIAFYAKNPDDPIRLKLSGTTPPSPEYPDGHFSFFNPNVILDLTDIPAANMVQTMRSSGLLAALQAANYSPSQQMLKKDATVEFHLDSKQFKDCDNDAIVDAIVSALVMPLGNEVATVANIRVTMDGIEPLIIPKGSDKAEDQVKGWVKENNLQLQTETKNPHQRQLLQKLGESPKGAER